MIGCKCRIRLAAAIALLAAVLPVAGQTGKGKVAELYLGGQPSAPIRIEVFSDFQCPHCRDFYLGTLKPLLANYAGANKVYIVYHDYPLPMHPFARKAARFALAAGRIRRELWLRVVDTLYQEQSRWAKDGSIEAVLARALFPAELAQVKKLAADPAVDAAVEQEIRLAQSRKITATPTFFVIVRGGREQRVDQPLSYPVLKDYIDRMLKR